MEFAHQTSGETSPQTGLSNMNTSDNSQSPDATQVSEEMIINVVDKYFQSDRFAKMMSNILSQMKAEETQFIRETEAQLKEEIEAEIKPIKDFEKTLAENATHVEQEAAKLAEYTVKETKKEEDRTDYLYQEIEKLKNSVNKDNPDPTTRINQDVSRYLKGIILKESIAEDAINTANNTIQSKSPPFNSDLVIQGSQDKFIASKLLSCQRHFISNGLPYHRWPYVMGQYFTGNLLASYNYLIKTNSATAAITWKDIAYMIASAADLAKADRVLWKELAQLKPESDQSVHTFLTTFQLAAHSTADFKNKNIAIKNLVLAHLEPHFDAILGGHGLDTIDDLATLFNKLNSILLHARFPEIHEVSAINHVSTSQPVNNQSSSQQNVSFGDKDDYHSNNTENNYETAIAYDEDRSEYQNYWKRKIIQKRFKQSPQERIIQFESIDGQIIEVPECESITYYNNPQKIESVEEKSGYSDTGQIDTARSTMTTVH